MTSLQLMSAEVRPPFGIFWFVAKKKKNKKCGKLTQAHDIHTYTRAHTQDDVMHAQKTDI